MNGESVIRTQPERRIIDMNFGFNSNVRVGEAIYHVQTEDRGSAHPFLDTVVYETGRVVYKRSTSYADFISAASTDGDRSTKLHELISQQHQDVIAQLEAGTLELRGKAGPAAPSEEKEAVDQLEIILKNPNSWLASNGVTFEIELKRKPSNRGVEAAEVEALIERDKQRVHCVMDRTDASGRATLKFQMPSMASEGASLVIRATDGLLYGELRFRLKAREQSPAPVSK